MPRIQVVAPGQPEHGFELKRTRTTIGRGDDCDYSVVDDTVSRAHCMLLRDPEGVWLVDSSTNGTRVNGELLPPGGRRLLADGDHIVLGHTTLVFHATAAARSAKPTVPMGSAPPQEEILHATTSGVVSHRAVIAFVRGPHAGRDFVLDRPLVTLGSRGAHIELRSPRGGPRYPIDALQLEVVRDRVILRPNRLVRCLVNRQPLDAAMPLYPEDDVQLDGHAFTLRHVTVEEPPTVADHFEDMIGSSQPMRVVFGLLGRVARQQTPVLVLGEKGTGKELVARAIHARSPRRDAPLVVVDMTGITANTAASQLFGYLKGAFTGADRDKEGLFHRAHGATIFLDEIGELPMDVQAMLLRVVQFGELRRIGATEPEYVDVRIIAATNRDLRAMAARGEFHGDLLDRLCVTVVNLPPLRDRKGDLRALVEGVLEREFPSYRIAPAALEALAAHSWPGNVRELENVIRRAALLCDGRSIGRQHVVLDPFVTPNQETPAAPDDEYWKQRIIEAKAIHASMRATATALGKTLSWLRHRCKKYGIPTGS